MLYTNLIHIETADEHARIINENENVIVICGRMGAMSIQIYQIAEELEEVFPNVKFYDLEYDNPESYVIRTLPELNGFLSIPYIIYYKNGTVVKATSGIQSKAQITTNLEQEFSVTTPV